MTRTGHVTHQIHLRAHLARRPEKEKYSRQFGFRLENHFIDVHVELRTAARHLQTRNGNMSRCWPAGISSQV